MLSEAYRVLESGGKAIFSVWGDKEGSELFTVRGEAIEEEALDLPKVRSNFHLNNKEKSMKMLEESGFVNVKSWQIFVPIKPMNDEELKEFTEDNLKAKLAKHEVKEEVF